MHTLNFCAVCMRDKAGLTNTEEGHAVCAHPGSRTFMPLRSSYWIWRSCVKLCCISLCNCTAQTVLMRLYKDKSCSLNCHKDRPLFIRGSDSRRASTSVISLSSENFKNAARERVKNAAARPVSLPAPLASPGSSFGPSQAHTISWGSCRYLCQAADHRLHCTRQSRWVTTTHQSGYQPFQE